jgi:hypothetical protein
MERWSNVQIVQPRPPPEIVFSKRAGKTSQRVVHFCDQDMLP